MATRKKKKPDFKLEEVELSSLRPHPRNYRDHPEEELRHLERSLLEHGLYKNVVVGSIIAAQAYPGLVVAMTPAPGYERKPPTEKRMRPDKFTVFFRER
jgi:hypothetical protein